MKGKIATIQFARWECNVFKRYYDQGRIALQLTTVTGEPVATATINLPEQPLAKDEVFIKDWSENEVMYYALHKAGVVGTILDEIPTGFVKAYRVKLLM